MVKSIDCHTSGKPTFSIWKRLAPSPNLPALHIIELISNIIFPACRPLAAGLLVLDVSRAQPQGACEAGVQTSLGGTQKMSTSPPQKRPPHLWALNFIFGHFWVKCQFWNNLRRTLRTFTHFRLLETFIIFWKTALCDTVAQLCFFDGTEACFWRNKSFFLSHNTFWESPRFVQWTNISAF